MAGVKDNSKILLLEDPASKKRKLEEMNKSNEMSKASEAVSEIRTEVDKLLERVTFYFSIMICHKIWLHFRETHLFSFILL